MKPSCIILGQGGTQAGRSNQKNITHNEWKGVITGAGRNIGRVKDMKGYAMHGKIGRSEQASYSSS